MYLELLHGDKTYFNEKFTEHARLIQYIYNRHEHHEMLCRPGCKCEQQYRMHRLLAFDPSNECRGIFSDWFELPSFCVCKLEHRQKFVFQ